MNNWDKLKIVSALIGTIIVPVVIGVVGNNYNRAIKERELQGKFVELSIQILQQPPSGENRNLRIWATNVIDSYSGISFGDSAKNDLIDKIQIPTSSAPLVPPPKEPETNLLVSQMPSTSMGGSKIGRKALAQAIGELTAGAQEIELGNAGKFIEKYTRGRTGIPWNTAFISWCFTESEDSAPFEYTLSAHRLYQSFKENGWIKSPQSEYEPQPGDIAFWFRSDPNTTDQFVRGLAVFVHHSDGQTLYTIEGNIANQVQGLSYKLEQMDRGNFIFYGFGHVPD